MPLLTGQTSLRGARLGHHDSVFAFLNLLGFFVKADLIPEEENRTSFTADIERQF